MSQKRRLLIALSMLVGCLPLFATGPSFHPDASFTGSSLTGWHTFGETKWRADNGEIVATPNGGSGWLVLDHSYQDVGLYTQFQCTAACETGVLLRAEKTADGMKGIYVALSDPDLPTYSVTIDSHGQIVERNKLRRGGGLERIAPPPSNEPQREFHFPVSTVKLPFTAPDSMLRPTDWNQVEILFDANIVRTFLNDGREHGAVGDEGYGPIALYAGGAGEVRFKDLAYKDLGLKVRLPDEISRNFRKQQLCDFFYSWSSGAADFNRDGILDIVSGPYIYYGPDYTKYREMYLAQTVNPSTGFASDAWMDFPADFTGDGWPDVVTVSYGGAHGGIFLYVNPKGENRRWAKYKVVDDVQSEIAVMRDVDGDGKPEIVYMGDGQVRYAKPDPANPTGPWIVHNVSEKGYGTAHGIGVGDINGDGRMDILNAYGWWEQPAPGSKQETWTYHPEVFGRYGRGIMGGSVMAVYDVNGDGLNDVVTVLNPHGWGMAWFEQKRDSNGHISFVKHMIMDDFSTKNAGGVVFSEPHGTTYADVDGDGIPDFIVGKRYWSHLDTYLDPDPYGQPVLYVYRTVRDPKAPGGARFVPELIDSHTGVGSDVLAVDLNKDGAMDIVTASRFGTFIYWGKPHK
ncbi:MAG TPA: FG-GAP-like repeat-containing protein [Acidobacteriaceae bacterium]|nr:FG-GAP-like repeat-containing protein [Acidobacteriaceae bacterium]